MMATNRVPSFTPLVPAIVAALLLAGPLVHAGPQRSQPQSPAASRTYPRAEAAVMAERLYRAALGRDANAGELSQLTAAIQRGAMRAQMDVIVAGAEFRSGIRAKNPAQMLEQIYQHLLNREPDTPGVNLYLPRLNSGRYAEVLVEVVGSAEFRDKNLGANIPKPEESALPTRLDAALDCQARVLDAARREASGLVFWSFDRLPDVGGNGATASGPGVDRFDEDRQLTYRCEGQNATYVYADRGRVNGADRRLEFPSAAVRYCMAAARDDSGRQITFDAAALSATDTRAEYVIGLAANTNLRVLCEMDGMRVVSVVKKP